MPYPPWWTARAAARRRELDAAVERLQAVVVSDEDIVGALVFGSYATGTVGPESDLDIMLVTTLPAGDDPGSRYARLAQRLSLGVPCDLIVYGVQELPRSFANGHSSRKLGAKAFGSVQQHPRELAGNWHEQARRDLDTARYLFEGARYDAACFTAQQAAEMALNAALIWLAGDHPRTHQLAVLINEVALHRADAVEALGDLAGLDPHYVTTRYPDAIGGGIPSASFFAPEGTLAIERASRAVAYVATLLPPSET